MGFTIQNLDQLVLNESLRGTQLNIESAKALLKKVVVRNKQGSTSSSALSFELPDATMSSRLESIRSNIDDKFKERLTARAIEDSF